jgi:hypothetical protein
MIVDYVSDVFLRCQTTDTLYANVQYFVFAYYTEEAKEYYQLAHDIKEYAKTFEETNEYQVVKVNPKETRKKLNLTFD